MNIVSDLHTQLTSLFTLSALRTLAAQTGFIVRQRSVTASTMVHAFLSVLECRHKINLADIQRTLCAFTGIGVAYKPFHNQLKKAALTSFFETLVHRVTAGLCPNGGAFT